MLLEVVQEEEKEEMEKTKCTSTQNCVLGWNVCLFFQEWRQEGGVAQRCNNVACMQRGICKVFECGCGKRSG